MESQWHPPTWNFARDATARAGIRGRWLVIRGRCLAVEAVVASRW